MVTGTAIKCSIEAKTHSGSLRRNGDGYVCQECWAREYGIERKEAKGRPTLCPKCGKVLMTRFRGGKVSISSMNMQGGKAALKCECGYEKVVSNPFSGRKQSRDEIAFEKLKRVSVDKKRDK